ncbi:hypothetical protein BDV93DRAFT_514149 [Ceratobasidium sp. AG-I]|nr:hypothetical protein BDV93DRAFT_514149 [Ceratobasidium sp. AG-I]
MDLSREEELATFDKRSARRQGGGAKLGLESTLPVRRKDLQRARACKLPRVKLKERLLLPVSSLLQNRSYNAFTCGKDPATDSVDKLAPDTLPSPDRYPVTHGEPLSGFLSVRRTHHADEDTGHTLTISTSVLGEVLLNVLKQEYASLANRWRIVEASTVIPFGTTSLTSPLPPSPTSATVLTWSLL